MRCRKCNSTRVIKNGSVRGVQRFCCKRCQRSFQKRIVKSHSDNTVRKALELYVDGMPMRAVARKSKVGKSSVQQWIRKHGNRLTYSAVSCGPLIELDELQFFVGNKHNRKWLWLAMCRDSMQILGLHVGGRGKRDFQMIWSDLKNMPNATFLSDGYEVYKSILPKTHHRKGKRHTHTIEGMMSVIRHYLARFRRRSRCFSKSVELAQASVCLFAQRWNQGRVLID